MKSKFVKLLQTSELLGHFCAQSYIPDLICYVEHNVKVNIFHTYYSLCGMASQLLGGHQSSNLQGTGELFPEIFFISIVSFFYNSKLFYKLIPQPKNCLPMKISTHKISLRSSQR